MRFLKLNIKKTTKRVSVAEQPPFGMEKICGSGSALWIRISKEGVFNDILLSRINYSRLQDDFNTFSCLYNPPPAWLGL
jgi:hypothetical protein